MSTRTLLPAVAGYMLLLGGQAPFAPDRPVTPAIPKGLQSAIITSFNTAERMTPYCRNGAARAHVTDLPNQRGRHESAHSANTAATAGVQARGPKSVLVLTLRSSSNTTRCTNATMSAILFTDKRSDRPYSGSVAGFYSENS